MNNITHRKEIILFVTLTFLISWGLWIPTTLLQNHISDSLRDTLLLAGIFSPSLVAIGLVLKKEGFNGLKAFFKNSFKKNTPIWLFAVLALTILYLVIGHNINSALGYDMPENETLGNIPKMAVIFIMQLVLITISEEFGWRAYFQSRMLKRMNPVLSGAIVGSVWALWHLPAFFSDIFPHYYMSFGQFFLTLMLLSIFVAMAQNKQKSSMLAGILVHATMNTLNEVYPFMDYTKSGDPTAWFIMNILLIITLLIIMLVKMARRPLTADMLN